MAQGVKDQVSLQQLKLLLWRGFKPGPMKFHMARVWQKKKRLLCKISKVLYPYGEYLCFAFLVKRQLLSGNDTKIYEYI